MSLPHRPPNGESWNQVRARVSATVDALLAEDPNDLIVVCHFGVVLSQLQRATGLQSYETFAQKIDNLSVTEVIIKDGNWNTGVINHCP
jgi:alpha-ribazole phosphatase